MAENFKSKDIGLRVQKKFLGKFSNKHIVKVFIDDTSGDLLDNLYLIVRNQSGNKKEAEKVIKNIVKIIIKIGILYRNGQFNQEEHRIAMQFKQRFHSTAMVVASFYEVEFSFDKNFLLSSLNECSAMLKKIIVRHLTEKSVNRVDYVFGVFSNPVFLDDVFKNDSVHRELLGKIVADMHALMESGSL